MAAGPGGVPLGVPGCNVPHPEYTYDPFGRTQAVGALTSNAFEFTGRENDGTGLYYHRARYYNPILHRFLSEDLLNFTFAKLNGATAVIIPQFSARAPVLALPVARTQTGSSIISTSIFANSFSIANNAPTRFVDPLGLWYLDLNVSVGKWVGGTYGVLLGESGIYPYSGGGIVIGPFPVSGSITYSHSDPTPGLNCGVQAQAGYAVQVGYAYGRKGGPKGGPFEEFGFGFPPGISLTCYTVVGPFQLPEYFPTP